MLSVSLICVGRLKEQYFIQMAEEYQKRLGAHYKLSVVQLASKGEGQAVGRAEINALLDAQGEQILKKIPNGAYVVALCVEGEQLSSEQLSQRLKKIAVQGVSSVAFVIGSSHGLSEKVKKRANLLLSMGPMTFPHRLARVMLLEQLYRAAQINAGTKYHK